MLPQLPRSGHLSIGLFSCGLFGRPAQSLLPFQGARGSLGKPPNALERTECISARCGVIA
jgi:hypothetical protein